MSDLFFRPLGAGEYDLFHSYGPLPASGVGARGIPFDELGYRPDWLWVALRGDEVVARAAFWGPPGSEHPFSLDWFDPGTGPDRVEVGAALLRAAYAALVTPEYSAPSGERPDFHLFLPVDWRERPDAVADVADRVEAAERAGLRHSVERLNLRWIPDYGLPPRSTRLTFTPAEDDGTVVDLLAKIAEGSLDAWDRRNLAEKGVRATAEATLVDVAGFPGGRHRWRLAHDASGDLVGIVMPTRNSKFATIGYIGVDPAHRGHGYADDMVAETLHIFTAEGEPEVRDSTDVGNTPMAASFARIGYQVVSRRMIMI
ncbi:MULTISPECIES: GNAT family N-acetyltransferase [Streptosporangium]|uniref:Ribosomal protein S18 acetylase RimI-like enzyme n=1 Tax=Streptosporangium brasiliense TaxID=47480 RepID=A0ABT9R035_9ACTN|nr:GNAT family N-acetyltransferase [Streptosporangium brasiliense]MDP9862584.1 ribosomal protein S18 acetylase RimI-like enzyme [Streptosporangium brasiliense]